MIFKYEKGQVQTAHRKETLRKRGGKAETKVALERLKETLRK